MEPVEASASPSVPRGRDSTGESMLSLHLSLLEEAERGTKSPVDFDLFLEEIKAAWNSTKSEIEHLAKTRRTVHPTDDHDAKWLDLVCTDAILRFEEQLRKRKFFFFDSSLTVDIIHGHHDCKFPSRRRGRVSYIKKSDQRKRITISDTLDLVILSKTLTELKVSSITHAYVTVTC